MGVVEAASLVLLVLPMVEAYFLSGKKPSVSLLFITGLGLSLAGVLGFITVGKLATEVGTIEPKLKLAVWVGVISAGFWVVGFTNLWLGLMERFKEKRRSRVEP